MWESSEGRTLHRQSALEVYDLQHVEVILNRDANIDKVESLHKIQPKILTSQQQKLNSSAVIAVIAVLLLRLTHCRAAVCVCVCVCCPALCVLCGLTLWRVCVSSGTAGSGQWSSAGLV